MSAPLDSRQLRAFRVLARTGSFTQTARELHITDGETTVDGMFSLEMVPCRGRCAEAPNVIVNDLPLAAKSPEDLAAHLKTLAAGTP